MWYLAQIPNTPQLPPLPEGPALDRVRGPIAIPAYEPWQIALATLCILLAVGGALWFFIRSRKQTTTAISPYEAAVQEIDLAAQLSVNDEQFAVLSSTALRRYLEDRLGLHFKARTSEEFLRSLSGHQDLDADFHNQLESLLATFDRVKFAQHTIQTEERIELTDTMRQLIDQIEQREKGSHS